MLIFHIICPVVFIQLPSVHQGNIVEFLLVQGTDNCFNMENKAVSMLIPLLIPDF